MRWRQEEEEREEGGEKERRRAAAAAAACDVVIGHNKEGGEKEAPLALPRSLSRLSPAPARSAPLRSLGRRPNISDLATQRRRGGPVTLRSVHPLFVTKRTLAGGAAPPARRAAPKATRWRHRLSVAECLGRTRHLISASSSFHRPHPRSLCLPSPFDLPENPSNHLSSSGSLLSSSRYSAVIAVTRASCPKKDRERVLLFTCPPAVPEARLSAAPHTRLPLRPGMRKIWDRPHL